MATEESKMSMEEVVMKLVGPVDPVGETREDDVRYNNLLSLLGLTESLIAKIEQVGNQSDRFEYSISRAGKQAKKFLKSTGENYCGQVS